MKLTIIRKEELNMKSTGVVRKVDELGRIVIPSEVRNNLNISARDKVEIFVNGDSIVLNKYQPSCIFCSGNDDITTFKGKNICKYCLEQLSNENRI